MMLEREEYKKKKTSPTFYSDLLNYEQTDEQIKKYKRPNVAC